jgi:hypothetical protein
MTDLTLDRLEQIECGCEGVTPGPWTWGAQWLAKRIGNSGRVAEDYMHLAQVPLNDYDSPRWNTDAAHIANCDPDTIRELIRLAKLGLAQENGK